MRGGRGGRSGFKGKPREKALLRSNVVKTEQTNSARRLQKDLKELEDQTIPLVGVSARPLSNSLYIWHGNLRGPEGTLYEGGVFHFEIVFPMNYPIGPPTIRSFTNIPHPNVIGGTNICLDILDGTNKEIYQGWTSAYTIETILIQLQSYLFEELPKDQLKTEKIAIKEAIKLANSFKCPNPDCNHQGPIKPYPPFNIKEKDLESFLMIKTPDELLYDELTCFHTKLKIKDTTLGIGVSISRLPRTGEIRLITPTLDLLSMRAFVKQKVRYSLSNERFTHWLPLFFGEKDILEVKRNVIDPDTGKSVQKSVQINCKERCLQFVKKSLCFICSGSTRKPFKSSMVLEVLPKLIITHIADMIQEFKHISILAIRRLVNFIRLFRLLLDLYPEVEVVLDQKIEEFIKNPEKRHKDFTGSLGDLLAMVTVSQKFKIEDILPAYLEEQMDRQAFWILREIPELDHEDPKYKDKEVVMEEARSEVCFKTGLAGFHITLFFYHLNKMVLEKNGKDLKKLAQFLDAHFGCLDEKEETKFQKKCTEIQVVKSFYKYYPMIGIPMPDEATLRERLKQSISNSRKKRYHGRDEDMNELPKIDVQAKQFLEDKVSPFAYYDEAKNEFLDEKDPRWMKACLDKFIWINQVHKLCPKDQELNPRDYALMSDEDHMEQKTDLLVKEKEDKLRVELDTRNETEKVISYYKQTLIEDYDKDFNWRDLFIKLVFEQMLQYFPQHQDFKLFYKYINSMQKHIQCLRVKILDKKHFKSNHYWLMTLVGRMTSLKVLKFHKDTLVLVGVDGFKFLQKGFKYLQENGGKLTKLQINNILGQGSDDYLYQCFNSQQDLRVLKINDCVLTLKEAQIIGKVISDFKQIQEVDLTNTNLCSQKSKEIADGLMRAKQLQILKVKNNTAMGAGATSILYNLAFSPKITTIDFTNVPLANSDTIEAIYKLIKISGSLETLILKNTSINHLLKEEFFQALGENKTLQFLNIDTMSTAMPSNLLQLLGKACAMNKRKNGNFRYLSMDRNINGAQALKDFFGGFKISDYEQEMWYGDKKVAKDMQKEQLEKKFEFGLHYLNLGNSTLANQGFKLKDFQKKVNPMWPSILYFFADPSIEILNLRSCQLNKNDMELLSTCIYQNPLKETKLRILNLRKNPILKEGAKILASGLENNKTIEVLDLSQCGLGVSGTQAIAAALTKNNTLKTLNLYRNKVDVDGARALRELLKVNTTLEFLDVGFNRLREKGIKALTDGITENPESKIKHLGVRFNFINDDGFTYFFENAIFKAKSKIDHIYLIQNYLSEHHTLNLSNRLEELKIKIFVDGFEKLQYQSQERLDRTIWISPLPAHYPQYPEKIWKFFQSDFECGLVADVRIKKGQKIPGKPKENCYAIIEYIHPNSVPRSLRVASKKKSFLDGMRFRIYKAGTRTMVFVRPQKRRQ